MKWASATRRGTFEAQTLKCLDRFVVVLATNIREILDKAVLDRVAGAQGKHETVESSLYGAVPLHGIQADQAAAILAEFQNVSNTKLYLPSEFPDKSEHPEMLWILRSKVIVREPKEIWSIHSMQLALVKGVALERGFFGHFGTRPTLTLKTSHQTGSWPGLYASTRRHIDRYRWPSVWWSPLPRWWWSLYVPLYIYIYMDVRDSTSMCVSICMYTLLYIHMQYAYM